MKFDIRLAKLEAMLDPGGLNLNRLTTDELLMAIWDVARAALATDTITPERRAELTRTVEGIEVGIRSQAALRAQPDYARHLEYVRGKRETYVPAVCGFDGQGNGMREYDGLHEPNIMARRAAILARPDVQALIADGGAAA